MNILFIIPDYDHYVSHFPSPISYLVSYIKGTKGYNISILNQDVYHFPESYITTYIDDNYIDIVALSNISGYFQYQKLTQIFHSIRESSKKPLIILGGHGPSAAPAFYIKKALGMLEK